MSQNQLAQMFNFSALHNDVRCIESLNPADKGTEHQFWFTARMLAEAFEESRQTLENNIQSLLDDEELNAQNNLRVEKIPAEDGKLRETRLFDLRVLNTLGMCCFRGNPKARVVRKAFNDVLVQHETGAKQPSLPKTYLEALEALVESEKSRLALEMENSNLHAQNGVLSQDYVSNKDVCLQLLAKGLAKKKNGQDYALSTLQSKVSPLLRKLSNENGYSVSEQIVIVNGIERKTPYYHVDVRDLVVAEFEKGVNA